MMVELKYMDNLGVEVFDFKNKQVRTFSAEGEIFGVAKDIANILGYKRSRNAIAQHCKSARSARDLFGIGKIPSSLHPQTLLINELDVERLKSRCRLKNESSTKYVYLILNPYTKQHKIGVTYNVDKRLSGLINVCGIELKLIASAATRNYKKEEAHLHDRFYKKRKIGEWFQLSKTEVKWIISYFASLAKSS